MTYYLLLQLVAALRIEPNNILLFHHPNAKVPDHLDIKETGFLDLKLYLQWNLKQFIDFLLCCSESSQGVYLLWQASLTVLGGTADIQAHANDSKVVGVVPLDTHELLVNARGSGTSLITIRDVGLATPASASALVSLQVQYSNLVETDSLVLHILYNEKGIGFAKKATGNGPVSLKGNFTWKTSMWR
jgi:hypothetical protein